MKKIFLLLTFLLQSLSLPAESFITKVINNTNEVVEIHGKSYKSELAGTLTLNPKIEKKCKIVIPQWPIDKARPNLSNKNNLLTLGFHVPFRTNDIQPIRPALGIYEQKGKVNILKSIQKDFIEESNGLQDKYYTLVINQTGKNIFKNREPLFITLFGPWIVLRESFELKMIINDDLK